MRLGSVEETPSAVVTIMYAVTRYKAAVTGVMIVVTGMLAVLPGELIGLVPLVAGTYALTLPLTSDCQTTFVEPAGAAGVVPFKLIAIYAPFTATGPPFPNNGRLTPIL